MSQTVRIECHSFLSRVRISVLPSRFFIGENTKNEQATNYVTLCYGLCRPGFTDNFALWRPKNCGPGHTDYNQNHDLYSPNVKSAMFYRDHRGSTRAADPLCRVLPRRQRDCHRQLGLHRQTVGSTRALQCWLLLPARQGLSFIEQYTRPLANSEWLWLYNKKINLKNSVLD